MLSSRYSLVCVDGNVPLRKWSSLLVDGKFGIVRETSTTRSTLREMANDGKPATKRQTQCALYDPSMHLYTTSIVFVREEYQIQVNVCKFNRIY